MNDEGNIVIEGKNALMRIFRGTNELHFFQNKDKKAERGETRKMKRNRI